ncbi:MAG: insulinase family protein [Candidatus Zixiibacteriota bacterium]|nr:MAG: insulinase family protein [candidate division Zixibacteria bacterium]
MPDRQTASYSGLYQKTTLRNGLRVITEKMPSVRSISLGVWVDVGSRNESGDNAGVTHLVEHTVFKGTRNRSAKQIAASLESIGGSLNAFTSKEQTCYTARILDEHLDLAVDVLSDLVCNASLTPVNIGREKLVILEEIKESQDTPSEYIHDLFASTYWGNHPLGRPILGEKSSLVKLRRPAILDYIKRNYCTSSIVVAAAGSVSHRKLVRLARETFCFNRGEAHPYIGARRSRSRNVVFRSTRNHQIHVCLGYPSVEYSSDEKLAALIIQAYLGGGMSSVLFQKIREEKGLAYTVYTFNEFYRDAGLMGTYLAADKKSLKACLQITFQELDRIKKRRLSTRSLDMVKAQLKGQLTLGMESTYSRMNRLARMELMMGSYFPLKQTLKAIDRIKTSEILELANKVFNHSELALAVLGAADKSVVEDVL